MSKPAKSIYVCGECGYESAKWLGKCPACDSWNTMVEEAPVAERASAPSARAAAVPLSKVDSASASRVSTGMEEFDRVLGGGIVAGSTVLLGGDPGIGKSTLLMQMAARLAHIGKVLYVTGEESAPQLKLRAERLGVTGDMLLLAETDLSAVEDEFERVRPACLIIDSIQTMLCPELNSVPGSVSQVREATSVLTRLAKTSGCAAFIVGHVTKEGAIAGPRVLEHIVDTVLYFEGDRNDAFRLLRAVKNRFGSTNEIGVFEMRDTGMAEVKDPSALFLSGTNAAGCAVTCALEGTRPMLVEVQALLSASPFNNPRRMAAGVDGSRLSLLLAVLEKKAGLRFYDKDVYVNVVGGLRLDERAGDLAVAMCIVSALFDAALPPNTAFIGELALTGEVRGVSRIEKRVQECARLGFTSIVLPKTDAKLKADGAKLLRVKSIAEAVKLLAQPEA
ncbi:MAG: DNA repair protein RadA [Clostridiaceae bacterium]|nr:DNA repair protein RadA [Eubacteriales bacterium]